MESQAHRVSCLGKFLAVVAWIGIAPELLARQTPPPGGPVWAQQTLEVWVHPVLGQDPASPAMNDAGAWIGDPDKKFKTLQMAIDAMQLAVISNYDAQDNPDQEGIVWALPGLYGRHGSLSSGDVLPIMMRDRVHVQGVGARRCVIRGAGTPNVSNMKWPDNPDSLLVSSVSVEVLVSFEAAAPDVAIPLSSFPPPWYVPAMAFESPNSREVLDGFTFEGGDVQVLFRARPFQPSAESAGRVSNCVFDMRHEWVLNAGDAIPFFVQGPYFGILMSRRSANMGSNTIGYIDTPAFIAHNTFILAQWGGGATNDGWTYQSRDEAVAIADVSFTTTSTSGNNQDCDTRVRGLANPLIVSNVFRTKPAPEGATVRPFAMLGVTDDDTQVWNGSAWVQTNAFDPARVGYTNGWFYSLPVLSIIVESGSTSTGNGLANLWNCAAYSNTPCPNPAPLCPGMPAPSGPAVPIWDGTSGFDPAFVGEYLSATFSASNSALAHYRDWRILPGSPLEDKGMKPYAGTARNLYRSAMPSTWPIAGPTVGFSTCTPDGLLDLFAGWDGEHWGNPRVVGSQPDIGFDERHLLICAGSWANDTNSHHASGFMSPHTSSMTAQRYFILPNTVGQTALDNPNTYLTIFQTELTPTAPDPGPGWINPPQTLIQMPKLNTLPIGYRTKYIAVESATGFWARNVGLSGYAGAYAPLGILSQTVSFRMIGDVIDDECASASCTHSYLNMQALVHDSAYVPPPCPNPPCVVEWLRGNLQAEYR